MIAVLDYGIGNLRSAEKALAAPRRRRRPDHRPGRGPAGRRRRPARRRRLRAVHGAAAGVGAGTGRPRGGRGRQAVPRHLRRDADAVRRRARRPPAARASASSPARSAACPSPTERLPHMGWNTVTIRTGSVLFDGLDDGSWLYFVHSYAPVPDDDAVVAATTDYGGPVVAAVEQGPLWATQFHPEKSAANGLRLLTNFAEACARRGGERDRRAVPRHRPAGRPGRAAAAGRLRRRDGLLRRPGGGRPRPSRRPAPAGSTSSTSTPPAAARPATSSWWRPSPAASPASVETGGGVRSVEAAERLIDAGVARVVVGHRRRRAARARHRAGRPLPRPGGRRARRPGPAGGREGLDGDDRRRPRRPGQALRGRGRQPP